jgi:hypothetical protein
MWRRLVDRLLNVGTAVVLVAWLVASAAIVFGSLGFEFHRGYTGVVFAIFLAPIAVWVLVEELVHRLKHGPTKPGRHTQAMFNPEDASEGSWRDFTSMLIWRIRVMGHRTLMYVAFLGFGLAPFAISSSFSMRWELALGQWLIVGSAVAALVGPWILHWILWKRRGTPPPWLKDSRA